MSFDESCMNKPLLWWMQNGDFPTPAPPPHLPVHIQPSLADNISSLACLCIYYLYELTVSCFSHAL